MFRLITFFITAFMAAGLGFEASAQSFSQRLVEEVTGLETAAVQAAEASRDVSVGRKAQPPLGSAEAVLENPAPVSPSEPYDAGRDVTSGIMAAGAALLGVVAVTLLVILIANAEY